MGFVPVAVWVGMAVFAGITGAGFAAKGTLTEGLKLVHSIGSTIWEMIWRCVYYIWKMFAWAVGIIEDAFMRLAGIQVTTKSTTESSNGIEVYTGEYKSDDLVAGFVRNETVKNMFNAFLVIAVSLIIFFTVLQIVREQYKNKDGGNPYIIVFRMFKGIITMLFITAAVLAGLATSGVVLTALRSAVGQGKNPSVGASIFRAMSYNANKIRQDGDQAEEILTAFNTSLGKNSKVDLLLNGEDRDNQDASVERTGGIGGFLGTSAFQGKKKKEADEEILRLPDGLYATDFMIEQRPVGLWLLPFVSAGDRGYLAMDFEYNNTEGTPMFGHYEYKANKMPTNPGEGGRAYANRTLTDMFSNDGESAFGEFLSAAGPWGSFTKSYSTDSKGGGLKESSIDAGRAVRSYLLWLAIIAAMDTMMKGVTELANIMNLSFTQWIHDLIPGNSVVEQEFLDGPYRGYTMELINFFYMLALNDPDEGGDEGFPIDGVPLVTATRTHPDVEKWPDRFLNWVNDMIKSATGGFIDDKPFTPGKGPGQGGAAGNTGGWGSTFAQLGSLMATNFIKILGKGVAPLGAGIMEYLMNEWNKCFGPVQAFQLNIPVMNEGVATFFKRYNQMLMGGDMSKMEWEFDIGPSFLSGDDSVKGQAERAQAERIYKDVLRAGGRDVESQPIKRITMDDAPKIERALVEQGIDLDDTDRVFAALGATKRTDYTFNDPDLDSRVRDVYIFEGTNSGIARVAGWSSESQALYAKLWPGWAKANQYTMAGCTAYKFYAALLGATYKDNGTQVYDTSAATVNERANVLDEIFTANYFDSFFIYKRETNAQKWDTWDLFGVTHYTDVGVTAIFYNFSEMNFFVGFMCIFVAAGVFINFMFALVQRLLELLVMYALSPLTLAMYPFDDGAAFKSRFFEPFYKKVISIYAIILSMSIFFLLLPLFTTVKLWPGAWDEQGKRNTYVSIPQGVINASKNFIVQSFIMIAMLGLLPKVRGVITAMLGAEALEEKKLTDVAKEANKATGGAMYASTIGAGIMAKRGYDLWADRRPRDDAKKKEALSSIRNLHGLQDDEAGNEAAARIYEQNQRREKGLLKYGLGKAAGALGKGAGKVGDLAKTADWGLGKAMNTVGGWAFGKDAFGKTITDSSGRTMRTGGLLQGMAKGARQAMRENSLLRAITDLDVGPLGQTAFGKFINSEFTRKGRNDMKKRYRDALSVRRDVEGDEDGRMEGNLRYSGRELEALADATNSFSHEDNEKLLGVKTKGMSPEDARRERMYALAKMVHDGDNAKIGAIANHLGKTAPKALEEANRRLAESTDVNGYLDKQIDAAVKAADETGDYRKSNALRSTKKKLEDANGNAKAIAEALGDDDFGFAIGREKAKKMAEAFASHDDVALSKITGTAADAKAVGEMAKLYAGSTAASEFAKKVADFKKTSEPFANTGQNMENVRMAMLATSACNGSIYGAMCDNIDMAKIGSEITNVPDCKLVCKADGWHLNGSSSAIDATDLKKLIKTKLDSVAKATYSGINVSAVADYDKGIKRNEVYEGAYLNAMSDEIKKGFEYMISSMSPQGRDALTANKDFIELWQKKDIASITEGLRAIQNGNIDKAKNIFKSDENFIHRFQTIQGRGDIGHMVNMMASMGDVDGMQIGSTPLTADNAVAFAMYGQFNQILAQAGQAQANQLDSQETSLSYSIRQNMNTARNAFKALSNMKIEGIDASKMPKLDMEAFEKISKKQPEQLTDDDADFLEKQLEHIREVTSAWDPKQQEAFSLTYGRYLSQFEKLSGDTKGLCDVNNEKNKILPIVSMLKNILQETQGKLENAKAPSFKGS